MALKYKFNWKDLKLEDFKIYLLALFKSILPKKRIKNIDDLNQAVSKVLNSNQKTILLVIYNSQNQRRYIGVKLD